MRHRLSLFTALMASTALGVPMAHAAQDAAPASAAVPASEGIRDIIVTAARHEQNLQKVSAAVSVIDGSALKEKAQSDIAQVLASTPSVQTTGQPGGFSVDVRGMGGDLPAGTAQGSAAVVFDGVYNINSQGTTVGFFDVNRVEVLAGPQSTRYGPNADGGLVNVYTNDPRLGTLEASGAFTYGNYNTLRGEAMLNIPISETLALRVAGAVVSRDSYFHPAEGEQRAQSLRVKLLYRPVDALTVKLSYQLDHIGGAGNGSNVFPVGTSKVPIYSGDSINKTGDPWAQSPSNPVNTTTANIYQHTFGGTASYDVSRTVALDVQGSYTTIHGGEVAGLNTDPGPWGTGATTPFSSVTLDEFNKFNQYTGELRLHNGAGSKVLWNLGFYHWNYQWTYAAHNNDPTANFGPALANNVYSATATNALYGEVTYPLTDSLRIIAGLRNSWDTRTNSFNNNGVATQRFTTSLTHADYRAGVEYDVAPRSMLYGTVSTGYRPGGQSSYNPTTDVLNRYQSEVNTAFEVGSKNRFLDNRLQVNADMFYYHISNYQNLDKYNGFYYQGVICTSQDTRAGCTTPTFGMGAHTLGAELSLAASLSADDKVSFNGTWLHARFNKKQGICATVGLTAAAAAMTCPDGYNNMQTGALQFFDLAGAVQPHSPTISFTFGYDHTFHFKDGASLKLGGQAFHTSSYWVNPVQDADLYGFQPGYWNGELNARFQPANEHLSVSVYVRNLANYAVKTSVLPITQIGDPRTYGITFAAKY
ncbi:TonB-dependent receptor [Novosphingobium rosa]|uniref:TonB-dependent receptor n=1 Tax=Novosphingobium rosa TaxID=76978 RepID=UPI000A026AE8|nr:TonB-dependent receptor [Novosphingobium rosa]